MKRRSVRIGFAMALLLLVGSTAVGQRRSPDPYQQESASQQAPPDRQTAEAQQKQRPQGRLEQSPKAGQDGGAVSRNPIMLALDLYFLGDTDAILE